MSAAISPSRPRLLRGGFTLVELLVVIAIIGILVAMLLPAVQAAREAARRTQCVNKLKQMGLGVLNLESTYGFMPTGGDAIFPEIENYLSGNSPNGPARQGLSWAFQILPYLEESSVHGITSTDQIQATAIPLYNCPSRRSATISEDPYGPGVVILSDYAGVTPCTCTTAECTGTYNLEISASINFLSVGLNGQSFFGAALPGAALSPPDDVRWDGVFVRTPWRWDDASARIPDNVPKPVRIAQITDGTSKTIMLGEKYVRSDLYEGGIDADDKGWSDGWDYDSMRSTCFSPYPDGDPEGFEKPEYFGDYSAAGRVAKVYYLGSAHIAGLNAAFADGSVTSISYDVELQLFNALGTRNGGELVDAGEF